MKFIDWFKYDSTVPCVGGGQVEIWKFDYNYDRDAFDEWAKHFRNQYCKDEDIDQLKRPTGKNREDYLLDIKFPDKFRAPGPSTRSGDFAEILVADFLEYIEKYWTPRTRYDRKVNKDMSTPGSDVIAIKLNNNLQGNELLVFEVKARIASDSNDLNKAIKDSSKDPSRIAESLNAMSTRFYYDNDMVSYNKINRIQQIINNANRSCFYGAALVCSANLYSEELASNADVSVHPQQTNLRLLLIKSKDLKTIVHSLYSWAAYEA